MTRKDYELVANGIYQTIRHYDERVIGTVTHEVIASLADNFADDNPRFDRGLFYRNCGLSEPNGKDKDKNGD